MADETLEELLALARRMSQTMPDRFPVLAATAAFVWLAAFLLATALPLAELLGQVAYVEEVMRNA